MSKILSPILLSFLLVTSYGQVREVKSRASSYKSGGSGGSSSSSDSYSYSSDDGSDNFFVALIGDVIFGSIYHGFSQAQFYQLNNANEEDWRISLEIKVNGGVNFSDVEFFDSQTIRGNWGLFSTQVRRFNVNDVSGAFTTIDWQIVQFNLINREKVRWTMGMGISHETQMNQTHFEWATEFQVSLFDNKWMPYVTYRKSGDGYPRTEFSGMLEFRPFRDRINEFSFRAGYVHQKLYDIPFHFPTIGVGFWLK